MNLCDFDDEISSIIIMRGKGYYEDGCVKEIKQVTDRQFLASVEGTEMYTVEIALDEVNDIVVSSCDCPYDNGPYCKHEVAVLFVLRDRFDGNDSEGVDAEPETGAEPGKNQPEAPSDIRGVLERQSKTDLVSFLCGIAGEDYEVEQKIHWTFTIQSDDEQLKQAKKLIRDFIRRATRRGFIEYSSARRATFGADQVLEKARQALSQKRYVFSARLAISAMSEMVKTLQHADDSDGIISGIVYESLELLTEIGAANQQTADEHRELFRIYLTEAGNDRYADWTEWQLELLEACLPMVGTPAMRVKLEEVLDRIRKAHESMYRDVTYFGEKIRQMRYQLIQKFDGELATTQFIEDNLAFPDIRIMAIEAALINQDYEGVLRITKVGIQHDAQLPGWVNRWLQYQYHAYEKTGDVASQRRLAYDFVLDDNEAFYHKLKSLYTAEEWIPVYQDILARLGAQKYPPALYTTILVIEGEIGRLMDYVSIHQPEVRRFFKDLMPQYPAETKAIYADLIRNMAEAARERKAYRKVCGVIKELAKAGGLEEAQRISEELYGRNLRRPAFLDELKK